MKYLISIALVTSIAILFISCSKDDDKQPSCEFIGRWCNVLELSCDLFIEFRDDGDYIFYGESNSTWESEDCQIMKIIENASTNEFREFEMTFSNDTLTMSRIGLTSISRFTRI